jgi:hypothetical protein
MYIDMTSFHTMSFRSHINVHYLDIIFWLTGYTPENDFHVKKTNRSVVFNKEFQK